MLELLWVEDPDEARSESVQRLGLWERWSRRDAGACPFGICYRPVTDASLPPPFESWEYQPAYAPLKVAVALTSTNTREPLLFYLPYPHQLPHGEPLVHAVGIRNLSSAVVIGSIMELTFDDGVRRLKSDFRPGLPLVIRS